MTILLLTLFAIALTITGIGFWLSPRPQASDRRDIFYTNRDTRARREEYGARNVYRARSVYGARQAHVRRPVIEYDEPRNWANNWAQISSLLNIKTIFAPDAGKQTPWLGILLILITLFGFTLFSLRGLLLNPGLMIDSSWINPPLAPPRATAVPDSPDQLFSGLSGASKALVRVYQLDPKQYASPQEYDRWAYSACSAASMTEVINSYGHNYRITDILNVESRLGEITPELGLVEPVGIDRTVAQFGFRAVSLNKPSLNDIIKIASQGRPVIVSFPPERWDGGHLLVLRGGDSNNVYLADSSRYNMTVIPRSKFLQWWAGFAVVVVPK